MFCVILIGNTLFFIYFRSDPCLQAYATIEHNITQAINKLRAYNETEAHTAIDLLTQLNVLVNDIENCTDSNQWYINLSNTVCFGTAQTLILFGTFSMELTILLIVFILVLYFTWHRMLPSPENDGYLQLEDQDHKHTAYSPVYTDVDESINCGAGCFLHITTITLLLLATMGGAALIVIFGMQLEYVPRA